MQSLYATGLKQPEDILQYCLTLFRKCDTESLAEVFATAPLDQPPAIALGNSLVYEQGPLANFDNSVLDVAARRVLPGHLLRRSRVLGTLKLDANTFQQRIALTARTGEESIFNWILQEDPESEKWKVFKVEKDPDGDLPLPTTLQPKASPEAVVRAQLQALKNAELYEASIFNSWRRSLDPFKEERRRGGRRPLSMIVNYEQLREVVAEMPFAALVKHDSVVFGPAACPTQKSMLQEIWVKRKINIDDAEDNWLRFVWKLQLSPDHGCWVCTGITHVSPDE